MIFRNCLRMLMVIIGSVRIVVMLGAEVIIGDMASVRCIGIMHGEGWLNLDQL